MTAYVRDVDHLEVLIDQFAAYGQTTSSVMQSSPVVRRGISTAAGASSLPRPQGGARVADVQSLKAVGSAASRGVRT